MPAQVSLDSPSKPKPNQEYALRQEAVTTALGKPVKHQNYFKEDEKNEREDEKASLL